MNTLTKTQQELEKNTHPRLWTAGLLALIIIPVIGLAFWKINAWYTNHYFQVNQPVNVSFKPVLEVKTKEEPKVIEVEKKLEIPEVIVDTPIKKYICEKWEPLECKTALAVAQSESGFREDAININTNNTIDLGIFQINSIHYKKDGCALKDVVDPYKNVDCAYTIWKGSGWGAWSAFNNESYLAHLEK